MGLELLEAGGVKIAQVRLSGGGARSPLWRQMQADVYGKTCATINTDEGPAYGAALLAAVGTGRFDSVPQACAAAIKVTRTVRPAPVRRRLYDKHYARYRRLYPALKEQFAALAELARR